MAGALEPEPDIVSKGIEVSSQQGKGIPAVRRAEARAAWGAGFNKPHGQIFYIGPHLAGYVLTSVQMVSEDTEADDIAMKVWEIDGTDPSSRCTNLTPPSAFAAGTLTFEAPAYPALTVYAGAKYMVVFSTPGGEQVDVAATGSDGEDPSSPPDWNNRAKFRWNKPGSGWDDADKAPRITINGTSNALDGDPPLVSNLAQTNQGAPGFNDDRA